MKKPRAEPVTIPAIWAPVSVSGLETAVEVLSVAVEEAEDDGNEAVEDNGNEAVEDNGNEAVEDGGEVIEDIGVAEVIEDIEVGAVESAVVVCGAGDVRPP